MSIIFIVGVVLVFLIGIIWAIGVACQGQVHDHEEICRGYYEWEEME